MTRKTTTLKRLAWASLLGAVMGGGLSTCSGAPDLCAKVTCDTGQFCDSATGMCKIGGLCSDLRCGPGYMCDQKKGCIPGPQACAKVTCPVFQSCDPNTALCVINDPPASMGAQIDRMGRPLVNTILTDPFDVVSMMTPPVVRDAYNADSSALNWQSKWAPQPYVRTNLGIFDGLDGNCGNQTGADAMSPRYQYLANIFANDMLLLNANSGLCAQYLGVETNPTAPEDCGGRHPSYDVVDVSYSVLAEGLLLDTKLSDGVASPQTFPDSFPYLNAPR